MFDWTKVIALPPRQSEDACRSCKFFTNAPQVVEPAIPGLASFGSAYSAARSDDGICLCHGRYVRADFGCSEYQAASLSDEAAKRLR
jgi:hypothetical protein